MSVTELAFKTIKFTRQLSVKNSYIASYDIPTDGLAANSTAHKDRREDSSDTQTGCSYFNS
jgi:hypothetical protein